MSLYQYNNFIDFTVFTYNDTTLAFSDKSSLARQIDRNSELMLSEGKIQRKIKKLYHTLEKKNMIQFFRRNLFQFYLKTTSGSIKITFGTFFQNPFIVRAIPTMTRWV